MGEALAKTLQFVVRVMYRQPMSPWSFAAAHDIHRNLELIRGGDFGRMVTANVHQRRAARTVSTYSGIKGPQ
jgi:hypothetical protein